MLKLILVRHTESLANKKGIYQGQTYDTNLTDLGKKQAELVAKRLKKIKIQAIYSSPLKRTLQTATIIALNKGMKVFLDKNLIEISHGQWEGRKIAWVKKKYPLLYKTWKTTPQKAQMPQGENCQQVFKRVLKFLQKLQKQKGMVVVVSHDLILRLILMKVLGLSIGHLWRFKIDNGALSMVELEPKKRVLFLNDTCHLQNLKTNVDKQAL